MRLVVGVNQMGSIGLNNEIPWRCSADFKLFRRLTLDTKCLVGRKTYESLPPLKRREFIVVGKGYNTLEQALAQNPDCCIGGAQIYEACLRLGVIKILCISHIQDWTIGDTYFKIPDDVIEQWELFKRSKGKKGIEKPEIKDYYLSCEDDPILDENFDIIN